jgi:MFS family permease
LADRFGYDPVFFTSAAIFLILLNLVMLFMPAGRKPVAAAGADRAALGRFLRSGPVWSFSLLCVGPICLASVGLINYFLPLHLNALGAGPALIGQLNALFSILVVLLAPVFGRCLDRSRRPWLFLVLAGFLAALAGPVLPLWPTVAGVLAALVLLGLAAALSEGGEPAYLLGLPAARALGEEPALSFYNTVARGGQMVGPLAVAGAWSLGGLTGLSALGGFIGLLSFLFWVLASRCANDHNQAAS